MLGVDVINLGFSGNGQSDPEIAPLLAEIEASCYVNDCIANMSLDQMKERYAAFNETIRSKRPTTPILLMTSSRRAGENYIPSPQEEEKNAIVRTTFNQFRKRGDKNVHLLDCRKIIGFDPDHPSVDGAHLTDLGFKRLADGVALALGKVLALKR
jgi:lysophospholipase L1-like esterase